MATIKSPTSTQLEAAKIRKQEKAIQSDICKIDAVLQNEDPTEMESLHRDLDGKYQYVIADWDKSMLCYVKEYGFNYEWLGPEDIKANLSTMRPKLEAFMFGWNAVGSAVHFSHSSAPDVNVTVNNNVTVNISFEQVREQIEDMTALSREQTDEIIERINELEEIAKEKSSRKTKWEKVKPIIAFALDKGADVAIAILSLVMQMKLGM